MSYYGLIKETSRIKRNDTIIDLNRVTKWRIDKGFQYISPGGPSIRKIENAVALMLDEIDTSDLPELVRGKSFYISIIPEIKNKNEKNFNSSPNVKS